MKRPLVRRIAIWYSWFSLGILFPSAVYYNFSSVTLSKVDENRSLAQAREVLGKRFSANLARKMQGDADLNYRILEKIRDALPWQWKDSAEQLTEVLIVESKKAKLDPIFIMAVIQTESSFNPETVGAAGEIGLMQILPGTGEWMSQIYGLPWKGKWTLFDPVTNVRFGITYFAHLREEFDGRSGHYINAYNMGTGNVRKIEKRRKKLAINNHYLKRGYSQRVTSNYSKIYADIYEQKKNREIAGGNSEATK
ncbi:lytic transglycosylase domain-containing protein [Bdellovibrio sp. HCB2-146]|uniref:lytic transglycosylase domain-containing protein n=1 Tax=Bdellovibrio sp. HCB2-146 TaxID=3394362 RepID=UPI0039BC69C3